MYADAVFHEPPNWSRRPGRRLALNLLPSTLIVAAVLLMLNMPVVDEVPRIGELVVRIIANTVEEATEEAAEEVAEKPPAEEATLAEPAPPAAAAPPVPDVVTSQARKPTDWYAQVAEAARATNDDRPREYSVNPGFDEKRRQAALQFAPSRAPVKRPIWENVEKDTLGRTILRSGDCYRVIDDPNVGSREAFETFGQFITTCAWSPREPQLLPWVQELKDRREGRARYGPQAAE